MTSFLEQRRLDIFTEAVSEALSDGEDRPCPYAEDLDIEAWDDGIEAGHEQSDLFEYSRLIRKLSTDKIVYAQVEGFLWYSREERAKIISDLKADANEV